jgi:hypothetical protein
MPPPPGWIRPGEAFPPHRSGPPPREAQYREAQYREAQYREAQYREAQYREAQYREGPPPRPGPPPRHGNPARDATAPREPSRPEAPGPPFDPRTGRPGPFGPGPGSGTGRPSAGPGHGPSAGRQPTPPGTFDGGYAQVIRPAEHPVRPDRRIPPDPGRPADPARPADSSPPPDGDVFVYRDVSDSAPKSTARHLAADDSAYWYDLLAQDSVPQPEESRGPFEPLLSSSGTPSPAGTEPSQPSDAARDERREAPEQARARKLEELKDLYLTAEAIGEQNVDKHFDQLLAQQRELISEYFRQSAASGPATPPEGVSVRAEPPRAW